MQSNGIPIDRELKLIFMKTTKKTSAILMLAILTLASCKKRTETDNGVMEDEIISNQTTSEFELEELYASLDCDYEWSDFGGACATVTESSTDFPKTITIDFGTGCTGVGGRTKKGKIIIEVSDDMRNTSAHRKITFDNFFVNDVQVAGERNVTNTGLNTSGNMVFSVIADMSFTRDGETRTRTINHQREWIAGSSTCEFVDDEYFITGTGETIGIDDREGTHTIITALHIAPGTCNYITSGSIEIKTSKNRGGTIDFGTGTCDNKATLTTFRGKVYEIDLDTKKVIY